MTVVETIRVPNALNGPGASNDSSHGHRVALVFMPFSLCTWPSIQLGLLGEIVRKAGFQVDTHHLNLELAAVLQTADYRGLCGFRGRMTGEWLFSIAAFGDAVCPDDHQYYKLFPDEVECVKRGGKDTTYLSRLRHQVLPEFIDTWAAQIPWGDYWIVGFSSTFQQNVASLALARRIKEAHSHVTIVFGGANMEGVMGAEYLRSFPYIDFVVNGEGDAALPVLLHKLAKGHKTNDVPGVLWRRPDGSVASTPPIPTKDLNDLPVPNYDEFFDRLQRLSLPQDTVNLFALPVESSRGCWWGRTQHCTFCGLNGEVMAYRSKDPNRFISELSTLATRHRVTMFQATDNILDLKYVSSLFQRIEETRADYKFFYETKSNLNRAQIKTLHRGGVRWVQPGIESLSTHVLKLMRKGCTMPINLRFMKWCAYYGLRVGWNLLWGFPGETEEDYVKEAAIVRLIGHLEPPNACSRLWLERFSPLFSDREAFPADRFRPEPSYAFAYPPHVNLGEVAYFYDGELGNTCPDEIHRETLALVQEWKNTWLSPKRESLTYWRTSDALFIEENRRHFKHGTHSFTGPLAQIYEACVESMTTVGGVHKALASGFPQFDIAGEDIQEALEMFVRIGLMISEDGSYLSLAIPQNKNW